MKTTIKLLAVLALALATFGQHTTASARTIWQFRGVSVGAQFVSFDPTGCIRTEVGISASDDVLQVVPDQTVSSLAVLYMTRDNICTGEQLSLGSVFAPLEKQEFKVSGDLSLATLNTTVTFHDLDGTIFDLLINLTWTADGPANIGRPDIVHTHLPGCNLIGRHAGTVREAEITGSVSDGTTNFTPEPAVWADLLAIREGALSVVCD